jgi:two-component system NtrC family sensor kinase
VLIQDSGSGIENENIDKIFNPFYTSKPKGHGLGLAVVKQIVSEHSGTISLLSTVGVGTLVSVMLPSKESSSTELE